MLEAIRATARIVTTMMNTCVNPACLHATKTKGCACCAKGCGTKKTAKKSTRSRRRR